jgi:hypothetical protein
MVNPTPPEWPFPTRADAALNLARWRERGKEARDEAERLPESIAKDMLLSIAETWERLVLREQRYFR